MSDERNEMDCSKLDARPYPLRAQDNDWLVGMTDRVIIRLRAALLAKGLTSAEVTTIARDGETWIDGLNETWMASAPRVGELEALRESTKAGGAA